VGNGSRSDKIRPPQGALPSFEERNFHHEHR
jgi:hypothetical protein